MEDNLCKQIRENLSEKVEENKTNIDLDGSYLRKVIKWN